MTQKEAILAALKAGDRLTGLIALQRFQCMTLAQRISELIHEGHHIKMTLIPNKAGGRKRIAEYRIDQPTEATCKTTGNANEHFSYAESQSR